MRLDASGQWSRHFAREETDMWRAFFLGIGIYLLILGLECLTVDRVTLRIHDEPAPQGTLFGIITPPPQETQVSPAAWLPWTLLSTGTVVCLYSFTIPKRMEGK